VLTRQEGAGKWNAATYALKIAVSAEDTGHRTHRTHRPDRGRPEMAPGGSVPSATPMGPMSPMPHATDDDAVPAGEEATI
jgi:hypothetical protein